MQVLTPTGYKNIEDVNIGDELVAYDINTGVQIVNILEGKQKWTETMLPPVVDENGNVIETSEQVYQNTYGDWKFYLINNTWTVFTNQSVWANGNVVHGFELQVGDVVYNDQDQDVTITDIQEVSGTEWWRLEVSGDNSYIADNLILHNASRYWVGGGSANTWAATANTNWGSASGGANNASVPTSVDDVIFDGAGATGNSASTISATITILSLNITTGYTQTMTHNAVVTIAGNFTFTGNYTRAGASGVTISAASTITSNGVTWDLPLTIINNITITLSGNLSVSGLFTPLNSITINSTTTETLTCSGGITVGFITDGTAKIILTGGTWSHSGSQPLRNPLDINGNVTISGTVRYGGGSANTFTYVSGTVTTTGSTFTTSGSCTLNTNGITWNNVTFSGTNTTNLTSNFLMSGLLTISASTTLNTSNSSTFTTSGGLSVDATFQGTVNFYLTGGTWAGAGALALNTYLNGNSTISSGGVLKSGGSINYVSGTITTTGSTLTINSSVSGGITLNTNGMTWNNVTYSTSGVGVTLTSNFAMSGLLTISVATTINKTASETWTTSGGITVSATTVGTADIYLTGGTWSAVSTSAIANNVYINGNVTISGTVNYNTGTLSYLSGTVTTTGSTLSIRNNCTLNTNGITWNNVTFAVTNTTILTSNFAMSGLLTVSVGTTINTSVGSTWTTSGGITISGGNVTGSAKIILTGGTWSAAASTDRYIGTNLDIQGNVTISGTVYYAIGTLTYVSGIVTTTGSTFGTSKSCTLNTNGITFNNFSFYFDNGQIITLTSNLLVNGLFTQSSTSHTINTSNGSTITINGGITINSGSISGTAKIILTGGTLFAVTITNSLDLQGNISISSLGYAGGTLTYVSGIITTTGSTLTLTSGSTTLNTNGITWNNIACNGTQTNTLTSNLTISGLLNITSGGTTTFNTSVGSTVTVGNGISVASTLQGSAKIILTGGTWSHSSANYITNNLDIQGNVTVSGTVYYGGSNGVLTYVSGNVNTAGSTLRVQGTCTLNTNGIIWNTMQNDAGVKTLTSDFTAYFLNFALGATWNGANINLIALRGINLNGNLDGTINLYLKGGSWGITGNLPSISVTNMYLDGDISFDGSQANQVRFGGNNCTITYLSGKITHNNVSFAIPDANTNRVINFHKMPLATVLIQPSCTLVMNQFFCGTPSQICRVSLITGGSNYGINFTNTFEKIGRFVQVSGGSLARPLQLIISNNVRNNAARSTNGQGIRYNNQSPNGFAKNTPSINDTMTAPALGLEADPCFLK